MPGMEAGGVRPARTYRARQRASGFSASSPAAPSAWPPTARYWPPPARRMLHKHVFTTSRSLVLKKWSLRTGEALHSWKQSHSAPVWDMKVDATGGLLATASADRTLLVWDVDKVRCCTPTHDHVHPQSSSPVAAQLALRDGGPPNRWMRDFMERHHSHLRGRIVDNLDKARFNVRHNAVKEFFDALEEIFRKFP
eukprot:jgi/Tetstr1/454445/TSEL_041345.t1